MVHIPKLNYFPGLILNGLKEIRNDQNLKIKFPLWIDHPKFIPNKLFFLNPEELEDDIDNRKISIKSFQNIHPIKQGAILFSLPVIPPVVITSIAISAIANIVAGLATFGVITIGMIISNVAASITLLAAVITGLAAIIILPSTIGPMYLTARAFYLEVLRVRNGQKTPDAKIVKKYHVHPSPKGKYTSGEKFCNYNYLKKTQKVYYAAMIIISPFLVPLAPLGVIATPIWARMDQKLWKVPPRVTENNYPKEEDSYQERHCSEDEFPWNETHSSQAECASVESYESGADSE